MDRSESLSESWTAQDQAFFGDGRPTALNLAVVDGKQVRLPPRPPSVSGDAELARRLQDAEEKSRYSPSVYPGDAEMAKALKDAEEEHLPSVRSDPNDAALAAALDEIYREETKESSYALQVKGDGPERKNNRRSSRPLSRAYEGLEVTLFQSELASARSGGRRFVDPTFGEAWWRRPDECDGSHPNDWAVVRDEPLCTDVVQGALGSCWLVSSMASLAAFQRGELVSKLFVTSGVDRTQDRGAHGVRLCVDGRWRCVLLDERFPVVRGRLHYAKSKRRQLFSSLVEKAYAKLCGGYALLEGGTASEALYVLTGAACRELRTDDRDLDELWATLLSAHEARFVCVASSKETASRANGLAPCHAYAVLSVLELFDIPNDTGEQTRHRLLRLANPHGRHSTWKGAWALESMRWTPDTLQAARSHEDRDRHGGFFVDLDELRSNFASVTICETRTWTDVRLRCDFALVVIEPTAACQATIHLAQPPARIADRIPAALLVFDARSKALVAASEPRCFDNIFLSCHLDADTIYLVVPLALADVPSCAGDDFASLVVETAAPAVVQRKCKPSPRELRAITLAYARLPRIERLALNGDVATYFQKDGHAAFYAVDNRHPDLWLRVECTFTNTYNCLLSRDGSKPPFVAHVPPRHSMLVVSVVALANPYAFEFQHQLRLVSHISGPAHHPALHHDDLHLAIPFADLWTNRPPPSRSPRGAKLGGFLGSLVWQRT